MRTFAESTNNDFRRGADGNFVVLSGLAALITRLRAAMQTQLGECALDTTRGVPTAAAIWETWNPAQFSAAARSLLTSVLGDEGTLESFSVDRAKHTMTYVATFKTIYQTESVTING